MTEIGKKGQMIFAGIDPMKIIETDEEIPLFQRIEHQETVRAIAKTVRAYLEAGADLLGEKYRHLRELAPEHLADPGNTLVAYCNGGVVIRYEKKAESFRVFAASLPGDLATGALMLSQNLVRCHQPTEPNLAPEPTGIELKFSVGNPATSELKEVLSTKIWFDAVIKHPERRSQPPHKPFCLLSVRNSFELELLGELIPENAGTTQGQRFIARSILRLPVGWECIEVYPFLEPDEWKPEYARVWAENDILAAVASQQFREASFRSLDPNAEARRQYGALLKTFKTLLDSEPEREQVLQSFLQSNPALLCPTHTRMWPKLALGARETDFVFETPPKITYWSNLRDQLTVCFGQMVTLPLILTTLAGKSATGSATLRIT